MAPIMSRAPNKPPNPANFGLIKRIEAMSSKMPVPILKKPSYSGWLKSAIVRLENNALDSFKNTSPPIPNLNNNVSKRMSEAIILGRYLIIFFEFILGVCQMATVHKIASQNFECDYSSFK